MAIEVNFWKCSEKKYQSYLKANKIIDTDFYLVQNKEKNTEILYLGKNMLSNIKVLTEDTFLDPLVDIIFDGGDANITLAILDKTKLL